MGNHLPYGITQCYLPPGRGDFPAFTPAEAGTRFSDSKGMQGWVDLGTVGVNSLPKTATRQRRDCDSNQCSSEPESGTLTTQPPSHPMCYWSRQISMSWFQFQGQRARSRSRQQKMAACRFMLHQTQFKYAFVSPTIHTDMITAGTGDCMYASFAYRQTEI